MWDLRNERKETSKAVSKLYQVRVQVRRALLTCWRPRRPRSFRGIGHRMRRFEDVRRRQGRSSGWFAGRVDGRGFVGDHLIHPDFTMRDQVPVVFKKHNDQPHPKYKKRRNRSATATRAAAPTCSSYQMDRRARRTIPFVFILLTTWSCMATLLVARCLW